MPNWCEGNLRIRGKEENIRKFLENEIAALIPSRYTESGEVEEASPKIDSGKYEFFIDYPGGNYSDFYIRNSKRHFFFTEFIEIHWPEHDPDEEIIICIDNLYAAWGFDSQGFIDHAKKYNIDFRMFGFEQGMQFSEIMTVTRDGEVKDESKKYDDWMWECPFPNLGG